MPINSTQQTTPPSGIPDPQSPTGTKRRLRASALTPEFAIEAFVDRACDRGNPDAGLFAIAASLAMLVRAVDNIDAPSKPHQEQADD